MKDWEYNVALVLSVGCLVMVIWIIGAGRANEKLQTRLQAQQVEIDRGNASRQVGSRIVQDMVAAGTTNHAMRGVLEKYGMVPPAPPPAVSVSPAKPTPSASRSKDKGVRSGAGK